MEQLLLKLARQLDAMDEASLMSQWAARTRNAADGAQAPGLPPQSAFTLEKADENLDAPREGRRAKVLNFHPRTSSD